MLGARARSSASRRAAVDRDGGLDAEHGGQADADHDRRREVEQERHHREHQPDGDHEVRPPRREPSVADHQLGVVQGDRRGLGVRLGGQARQDAQRVHERVVVRRPDRPARRGSTSRRLRRSSIRAFDRVEDADRGRRERRERGVDVRDAVRPPRRRRRRRRSPACLRTNRSQSPSPRGCSSLTHTTDPGHRDLLRPVRVDPQRPPAGLHDGARRSSRW